MPSKPQVSLIRNPLRMVYASAVRLRIPGNKPPNEKNKEKKRKGNLAGTRYIQISTFGKVSTIESEFSLRDESE